MAKHTLFSRLYKQIWGKRQTDRGFTLIELLVVTAIAGGLIAGLTFIVVQLMGSDQREASRTEAQRDMQSAMDYISSELREATYVYTGDMLNGNPGNPNANAGRNNQPLTDFLPAALTQNGSVPVLAFWKQQRYDNDNLLNDCVNNFAALVNLGYACNNGGSYALVVYSMSKYNPSNTWSNNARITRYVLQEVTTATGGAYSRTPGYVNPSAFGNNFDTWPYATSTTGGSTSTQNMQTVRPSIPGTGQPTVLVDFLDTTPTPPGNRVTGQCPPTDPSDPTRQSYNISPSPTAPGLNNVRSFYVCTKNRPDVSDTQDVIVFLRGSVVGRPGYPVTPTVNISINELLPTLESRIFIRGVLDRQPPS